MAEATWWQRGVIYQIYPRSFVDSDGDGVGDLPGILARLDHLTWLGVDAVWLSPVHPSPMDDFGYDISDYTDVDPVFGTLADLDDLVAAAQGRGLRVLMDWVPNHTSDRHPWFQASRSGRDDPRRDWYIWRDPRPGGGPPTNWLRYVGDSAWCWDERTGQYYYRVFLDSQPDLNWRNPQVQEAMFDTLRFWLGRGIDGFRIDALVALVEDAQLRDNPPNPNFRAGRDFPYMRELSIWNIDQPETRELAARMRKVVDEFGDDRVLLAELGIPLEQAVAYYGGDGDTRSRSTSSCSAPPGTPAGSPGSSTATWPPSRPGPGPTGCSATTTPPGWPAASARPRPGWRPCCCSPCRARPSSTRARSWA